MTPLYSGDTFLQHYIGAIQAAMVGETLTTISPVLGDLNFDGKLTTADIQAMISALTNLPTFESQHGLSNGYLLDIADLNGDGVVNNADVSALLTRLATATVGTGSAGPQAVPEPPAVALAIAAFSGFLLLGCRRRLDNSRLHRADLAQ